MSNNTVAVRELTADELNQPVTFEEAIAQAGLSQEDMLVVASPYTVLNKDKDALLAKPFFVRMVRFTQDDETGNEYVVFYAITQTGEMYVVTDGSTGIRAQFESIVKRRAEDRHPTPYQNFLVANGLRKSEYMLTADGVPAKAGEKGVSKAATYYLG